MNLIGERRGELDARGVVIDHCGPGAREALPELSPALAFWARSMPLVGWL